jgi:hypothetical protein
MEHPLIGDISDLRLEDLTDRINDLHKKLQIAQNTGNGYLANQLRMALETYQNQYQARLKEQIKPTDPDFTDKINIE